MTFARREYLRTTVLTVRWDLAYRILRRNLAWSPGPNPDIDWRRVRSCSQSRCWEACITSIRLQRNRRRVSGDRETDGIGRRATLLRSTILPAWPRGLIHVNWVAFARTMIGLARPV